MSRRSEQLIGAYKIVRSHRIDIFEGDVQDLIAEGYQPLNRQGFESNDAFDYIMEMVKYMDVDEYREMVFGLRDEQWDSDSLHTAMQERDDDGMIPVAAPSPPVTQVFADELFNNE